MSRYRGFSTYNRNKKFRLTDFQLVKQDLLNHFHIRRGEKLMNPEFGTIIWDTLFEPFDSETKNRIVNDINKIVGNDPRIAAENVSVLEYEHGIMIELDLIYIKTNERDRLLVKFNRDNNYN